MKDSSVALKPFLALLFATTLGLESPAPAQLTPDGTLGGEASTVTPDALVQGDLTDLIEGGAIRGGNLFHSFLEFNVDLGQRVYFANPAGVESILSRVTGGDLSNIFGTLGVDGAADLFLINPNGIVFGENASLDIQGSFYATTAEAIPLGEGVYSATAPEQSSLLTVDPSALFSSYLSDASGDIENRGQLAAQGNMTLAGNNLDLQGQVAAGGDLTLLGNVVQIRDTVAVPFVGFAGGDLLVQGDEGVDIVALSHPESGLYAYGDMVLRSANPVGGDAHYWSLGEFRVETLKHDLGSLYSPNDPIIFARGNVSFDAFLGASLHIFAGGEVNIPSLIQITGADALAGFSEDVTLSDGTVVAIRGATEPTVDIRAGVDASLLAGEGGIGTGFIFNPFPNIGAPNLTNVPTSSNINIGYINFTVDGINSLGGRVLITNQYRPNISLPDGNIQIINSIDFPGATINSASTFGDGGDVYIDARGSIRIDGTITTSSGMTETAISPGNAGNIRLIANENIELFTSNILGPNLSLQSTGLLSGSIDLISGNQIHLVDTTIFANSTSVDAIPGGERSGNIYFISDSVVAENSLISTSTLGGVEAGNITIISNDSTQFIGTQSGLRSDSGVSFSGFLPDTERGGGNITLQIGSLLIDNGTISASTVNRGDSGLINIHADGHLNLQNNAIISSNVEQGSTGSGGGIFIEAGSLELNSGSQIQSLVSEAGFDPLGVELPAAQGNSGIIIVDVVGDIEIGGIKNGFPSQISTVVQSGSSGNSGNIQISANALRIAGQSSPPALASALQTNVSGVGNAGDIYIDLTGPLQISGPGSGVLSAIATGGIGNSGNINIEARAIQLVNGSQIAASHGGNGSGIAGDISIRVEDQIFMTGDLSAIQSILGPGVVGNSGNIELKASSLVINSGGSITTVSTGLGNAGNIIVNATDFISSNGESILGFSTGISSSVLPFSVSGETDLPFANIAIGNSGDIFITTGSLFFTNGSFISSGIAGEGNAGSITVEARDSIVLNGASERLPSGIFSEVDFIGIGNAGLITLIANNLQILNGAQIRSLSNGEGNAAQITIDLAGDLNISGFSSLGPSGLFSLIGSEASGDGGNIATNASNFSIDNFGQFNASNTGVGNAGNIIIGLRGDLQAENADISTFSRSGGGGSITIQARQVDLRQDSDVTSVVLSGAENAGNIVFVADFVFAFDDSDILASAVGGEGGDIDFSRTQGLFAENYVPGSLPPFEGNDRVDINATGGIASGDITFPDTSFIENSLTNLADVVIDTAALTAGSCIARTDESLGSFTVTGSGGLPQRPGDSAISAYPTGTVQTLATPAATHTLLEPDGVYQLPDGRLVLSRACE